MCLDILSRLPCGIHFCKTGQFVSNLCIIIFFISSIFYILLHYSHYATCQFNPAFCTPFHLYIDKIQSLHESTHQNNRFEYTLDLEQEKLLCNKSIFNNPCKESVKFGILLTETHYSNHWILQNSNVYEPIIVNKETISTDWNDEQSVLNTMDRIYSNFFANYPSICDDIKQREYDEVYYFKILETNKISSNLYRTLVDCIYCHKIMILQIMHTATMESIWNTQ